MRIALLFMIRLSAGAHGFLFFLKAGEPTKSRFFSACSNSAHAAVNRTGCAAGEPTGLLPAAHVKHLTYTQFNLASQFTANLQKHLPLRSSAAHTSYGFHF